MAANQPDPLLHEVVHDMFHKLFDKDRDAYEKCQVPWSGHNALVVSFGGVSKVMARDFCLEYAATAVPSLVVRAEAMDWRGANGKTYPAVTVQLVGGLN